MAQVSTIKDIPSGPHFVVMVFTTRSEADSYEPNNWYKVPAIEHYVFTVPSDLHAFILECQLAKKEFIFYKVDSLGKADISVKTTF